MTANDIKTMCDPGAIVKIKFDHIEEPQEYRFISNETMSYLKKVDGPGELPIWDFVHATYVEVEHV